MRYNGGDSKPNITGFEMRKFLAATGSQRYDPWWRKYVLLPLCHLNSEPATPLFAAARTCELPILSLLKSPAHDLSSPSLLGPPSSPDALIHRCTVHKLTSRSIIAKHGATPAVSAD